MAETFAELNITDTPADAAEAVGLPKPTELQERLLPILQSGTDVLLRTGSGRSVAYLLPLMQRLLEREPREGRGPRSLILSPSRDAAMAIGRTIKELGHDSPLRFGTVVGGRPYPMQHQLLRRPLDILVATPTRLMDHMKRSRVPFERLEILVIERVDEMLAAGLEAELDFIAEATAGEARQTVLLCGQIDAAVEAVSARIQADAQRVEFAVEEQAEDAPSPVEEQTAQAPREPRRRPRHGRGAGQARRSRGGQKKAGEPRGEVNGNVAETATPDKGRPKSKAKGRPNQTAGGNKGQRANKGGNQRAQGQGRRAGGQGRRQPDVRFPSDYANGNRQPASPADAAEQHREVKRHERMQYLADYGFSSGPRERKPVTVVYRNKSRKTQSRESENNDDAST